MKAITIIILENYINIELTNLNKCITHHKNAEDEMQWHVGD